MTTLIPELTTRMNGKKIKKIWWIGPNGDKSMATEGQRTLMLSATPNSPLWVVQYDGTVEVARHNCKFIASIEWA